MGMTFSDLTVIARRSGVAALVLVETAVEMQSFQDHLDGRGDGRRIATDVQSRHSWGDTIEVAELMDVVERRHHLRGVDRQTVIECQDETLKISHREVAIEDGQDGALNEL